MGLRTTSTLLATQLDMLLLVSMCTCSVQQNLALSCVCEKINTIVAMQQIYCLLCASRHFLSNLGSLVDVHVILDSLQGATG